MNGAQPERSGNRDPHMSPHGVFRCTGEDRWLSLAIRSDGEWTTLAGLMGRADLATDPRFATLAGRKANEDDLEAVVGRWTAERSCEAATAELQAAGLAAFPCMSNRDLATDAHLSGRDFFVHLEHPEVGARQHVGIPWKLHGSPLAVQRPAPCLGQHTRLVLSQVLGYDDEEIARLERDGVLT